MQVSTRPYGKIEIGIYIYTITMCTYMEDGFNRSIKQLKKKKYRKKNTK